MNRNSSSLSGFDIIVIFVALILTIVGGWLFYLQNRRDLEITKQKIEVYLRQKELEHSEKMAKESNEQERILNERERLQKEKSVDELPSQNRDLKP
jgi:regulatory protein YycI of two-component signal transduction system YycFG